MRRSSRARRPNDKVVPKYFALKGGLNLVDAPITMPNGMVLAAVNYELLSREGYRRIDGFERFDGQPSPSEASYWILNFDAGSIAEPEDNGLCTGVTSGATGDLLTKVVTAGTWAGNDAEGYFVLGNVVGSFQNNETLTFTNAGSPFTSGFSSGFA